MRYLLPLLFLLGACQAITTQPATDGSTQAVAMLTSNVIDDGTCAMEPCACMDATDCPMAGAAECSMEGDADCAKEDCAEGSACCKQSECEEE